MKVSTLLDHARQPPLLTLVFVFGLLYSLFLYQHGYRYLHIPNKDLVSFYTAAVAAFDLRLSPYSPDLLQSMVPQRVFPFVFPPSSLLPYYPLSLLGYEQARVGVLILNHLFVLWLLYALPFRLLRLSWQHDALQVALAWVVILHFAPLVVTIHHGQSNVAALVLVVAFWLAARAQRPVSAGVLLSLAILLKPHPALLLVFLAVCRGYRSAAAACAGLSVAILLSLVVLPAGVWRDWFTLALSDGLYGGEPAGVPGPASTWNQSLNGFFARILTDNAWTEPWYDSPRLAVLGTYAAAALLVFASAVVCRRIALVAPGAWAPVMHVVLPLMFLISPYSWQHHLVFLLPTVLAFLVAKGPPRSLAYHAVVLASATMLILPGGLALDTKLLGALLLWGLAMHSAAGGVPRPPRPGA